MMSYLYFNKHANDVVVSKIKELENVYFMALDFYNLLTDTENVSCLLCYQEIQCFSEAQNSHERLQNICLPESI
jgi:hypothetical protein